MAFTILNVYMHRVLQMRKGAPLFGIQCLRLAHSFCKDTQCKWAG